MTFNKKDFIFSLVMAQTHPGGGSLTVKPKGKFLIFLRKREPNRTQKEVEDSIQIPNLRLSLYERSQQISLDHLFKLADYYSIPARELVEPDSLELAFSVAGKIYCGFSMTETELVKSIIPNGNNSRTT